MLRMNDAAREISRVTIVSPEEALTLLRQAYGYERTENRRLKIEWRVEPYDLN